MTDVTTSADYAALLRGILEEPASDLRRLVAADWLDENCQSDRAEFIRVQIELATSSRTLFPHECDGGPACVTCETYGRGQTRANELLAGDFGRNWRHWLGRDAVRAIPEGALYYNHFVLERGFVSEVTLTQATFVGRACGDCDGQGGRVNLVGRYVEFSGASPKWEGCAACSGTGRTPGLAAALFRAHPITAVTLSDCEPLRDRFFNGRYFWRNTNHDPNAVVGGEPPGGRLHPEVFNCLPAMGFQNYVTHVAASEALSHAAVAHGRSLAGLPHLPVSVAASA